MVKAAIDLSNANSKRCGDAQHCTDNGEDIDRVTDGTVYPVAYQRIQRRAQRQRQAMAKAEKRENQSYDGINCPGMQTPMKKGYLHCLACGHYRTRFADGRINIMHYRLGHPEEHQAYPHAGGEQHGEPGDVAVIGLAMIWSQLDVTITTEGKVHDSQQNNGHRQHIEPA